ncbi:hypothetical protein BDQ17DRAFT_1326566 [Cyathus striatus]|nr:hypothetical protein BDQ17DRAFT_1326566 [Cyathus striatus]
MNSTILQYNKYNYTKDELPTSTITTTVANDLHGIQLGKLIQSIIPPLAQAVCNGREMLSKHAISSNISLPWTLNPVSGISLNLKHILPYPLVISNTDNPIIYEINRRMKAVESGEDAVEDTVLDGWKVSMAPPGTKATRPPSWANALGVKLNPPIASPERLYFKSGITMTLFKEILDAYAGTLEDIDVTIIADEKPTEVDSFRLPQLKTLKITSSVPLGSLKLFDTSLLETLKLKLPGKFFNPSADLSLSFDARRLKKMEIHCNMDISHFSELLTRLGHSCYFMWKGCISGSATTDTKKHIASRLTLQIMRIDCAKHYEDLLNVLMLSNSIKGIALKNVRLIRM